MLADRYKDLRKKMVEEQIIARGIKDKRIIEAFLSIPREAFVPSAVKDQAYKDYPLPIGYNQTISQPYMVALMTELISPQEGEKVLEIGTGSGYQSAVLAYLKCNVFSIERIPELAKKAKAVLEELGFKVNIRVGDGTIGWEENAPYDKIIVTAAAEKIPTPLISQLKERGKMVIPVGDIYSQQLILIDKRDDGKIVKHDVGSCIFVPLVGKYGLLKLKRDFDQ